MAYSDVYNDSALYHITANTSDERCISPKANGTRCGSQWLDIQSKVKIQDLHFQITQSRDAHDIVMMMLELVLARCNSFAGHREKLSSRPVCHREVAELYIDKYLALNLIRVNVPRGLDVVNRHTIRPGTLVSFVPSQSETMSSVLVKPLPLYRDSGGAFAQSGFVYGFTSTAYPDVVKIGYTGKSAQARMNDWAQCMPGGEIVIEAAFDWPERMEELIHLELLGQRKKVAKCLDPRCPSGHQEFFELPAEEIQVLIGDWQYIVAVAPLYDAKTRRLEESWHKRLGAMHVSITAWELRKVLQQEIKAREQQKESDQQKQVHQKEEVATKLTQEMLQHKPSEAMESAAKKADAKDITAIKTDPDHIVKPTVSVLQEPEKRYSLRSWQTTSDSYTDQAITSSNILTEKETTDEALDTLSQGSDVCDSSSAPSSPVGTHTPKKGTIDKATLLPVEMLGQLLKQQASLSAHLEQLGVAISKLAQEVNR